MISSLISAASSLLGGLINSNSQSSANQTNLRAVRETNKANAELARYNWQQQKEMWDLNNYYNTPLSQMNRLRDAGLNPHLVYGNGSVGNTSGNVPTPQLPTMQAPRVEPVNYGNAISSAGQSYLTALEYMNRRESTLHDNALKDSQAAAKRAELNEVQAKTAQIMMETASGWQDYNQARQLFKHSLKAAELNNVQLGRKVQLADAELSMYPLKRADIESQIALRSSNEMLNMSNARKISAEIGKISQEIRNLAAQENNLVELGRKLKIDADIASMTQAEQVALIQEKLVQAIIDNDIDAITAADNFATGHSSDLLGRFLQLFSRGSSYGFTEKLPGAPSPRVDRYRPHSSGSHGSSGSW